MNKFLILIMFSLILASCNKKKGLHEGHSGHGHGAHEDHSDHGHGAHEDHSGHDHAAHEEHSGDDHAAHEDQAPVNKISTQALQNMGVKIESIDSSDYTIYTPVPAVIREAPRNEQPLFAPFGGRVKSVNIVVGEHKKAGSILISLYRSPIQRPELKLVSAILTPASEEYHTAIGNIRQSLKGKEILSRELERLLEFQADADSLTIVPRKDMIDLKYEIEKIKRTIENSRTKLKLHGLNKLEISKVEKGELSIDLYEIWKNTLKSNNIWNASAARVLKYLNDKLKKNRWTIATIGELVANDLLSEELLSWFEKDASVGRHFLDIVRLLQEGHTINDLKNLHSLGAFNDIIEVRAPVNETGWDIEKIFVKVGQKVESGGRLMTLTDQSKMLLLAYPQSSEIVDMSNAAKRARTIEASTLVSGAGPVLQGLKIDKIRGTDEHREEVLITVENVVLVDTKNGPQAFRTWALRDGLKYTLKIPVKVLKDVIVLPRDAVITHGADQIVFVKEHGEYIRRKVVVVHKNSEVMVIGDGSELLPEEEMVVSGAFALQLALVAGTPEAVDPHAGHNH